MSSKIEEKNPKINPDRNYLDGSRIQIERDRRSGTFLFQEIFKGFDSLNAVQKTFGKKTKAILSDLRVEVFDRPGFMGVSDEDGHIFASGQYLRDGDEWSIYLDVVHELVHVKQFMDGRELFDHNYSYGDRPTEVEAYRVTVEEARRIGVPEDAIFEYLEVPWMTKAEHFRLAIACGLDIKKLK